MATPSTGNGDAVLGTGTQELVATKPACGSYIARMTLTFKAEMKAACDPPHL